jgi:uncharacterized membrane protein YagU involved in acid resistance
VFLPTLGIALDDRFYALALLGTSVPWFFVAGYAVIYRYRRVSNATERQQTKWVMAGMLGTFIVVIPFLGIATAFPPSQPSPERLAFVTLVLLPISALTYFAVSGGIAFAILRYRLYDVDIIIRRTLQYSVFTGVLALTYFGSIVVLQSIFTAVTGQSSAVIVVISTLAIAALFAPLRRRVQDVIDRRFFRKKYDAAKTLADFAATCRDETDLDTLTARLVEVVDETMQPESVALWLKPTEPTPSGKRIADQ